MDSADSQMNRQESKRSGLRRAGVALLRIILTAVVVYFVGRQLVANWPALVAYRWKINYPLLVASFGMHLVTFALFAWVWCLLMRGFGYQVAFRHGFKVAYIANLGRYIPGRIWPVFGMVYFAKKINITKEAAVTSWGVAQLFAIPPSIALGLAVLALYPEMVSARLGSAFSRGLTIMGWLTLLVSLLLVFAPRLTLSGVNAVLKVLKRPGIQLNLPVPLALAIYFGYLFCWICYGVAFWLFVHAVAARPEIPLLACIGAFVIAYQVGYLAIVTPGGLGARELVLLGVLSPYLGSAAAGLAVLARIWNTVSDILASLLALKIKI